MGPYDEVDEFPLAVRRHVERFYAGGTRVDAEQEIARILGAVARGKPLRNVCLSSLLLRMLFTVYAPRAVPEEIHVARLYRDFWRARVERDQRAGETATHAGTDLSAAAGVIALAMLAEGSPEVPRSYVDDWCRRASIATSTVDELASRGVLVTSEDETVRFFHQTLSEHGAARGLLALAGARAFDLLLRRLETRPTDVFVTPVIEQALILAETGPSEVSQRADESLIALLENRHALAWRAGTYVYAYRRAIPVRLANRVRRLIARDEEELADTLVRALPSVVDARLPEMFALLDTVWDTGPWRVRRHILESLAAVASRAAGEVEGFLARHDVQKLVVDQRSDEGGDRILLDLYSRLADSRSTWVFEQLVGFYLNATRRSGAMDLHCAIVRAVSASAEAFEPPDVARRFHSLTARAYTRSSKVARRLAEAHGLLWAIEWRARRLSVEGAIAELDGPDTLGVRARLNALGDLLLDADVAALESAIRFYEGFEQPATAWLWAQFVWPRLLRGAPVETGLDAPPSSCASAKRDPAVVRAARAWWAATVGGSEADTSNAAIQARRRAATAFFEAQLPPSTAADLLADLAPDTSEQWLTNLMLRRFVAPACVAGLPLALAAAKLAARSIETKTRQLAEQVADTLGKGLADGTAHIDDWLDLAEHLARPDGLCAALDALEPSAHFEMPSSAIG